MKKTANVNDARCVACGVCLKACPRGAIRIVAGCFASVDGKQCVGCGLCARKCPADCIRLEERSAVHA